MTRHDKDQAKLPVTPRLLKSVRGSRAAYMQRLEAESKKKAQLDADSKASGTTPNQTKRAKELEEANNGLKEATSLRNAGMRMLNEGLRLKDLSKVSAANALLERSQTLQAECENRKKSIEDEEPKKKRRK